MAEENQQPSKHRFFFKLFLCPLYTLGTDIAGWFLNIYTTINYFNQNKFIWGIFMVVIIVGSSLLSATFCGIRLRTRKDSYPLMWKTKKRKFFSLVLFCLGWAETCYALDVVIDRIDFFRSKSKRRNWEMDEENEEDAAFLKKDKEKALELSVIKIMIKYSRNLWTAILHANFLVNYVVFDPDSFCAPSRSSLYQRKYGREIEKLDGFLATKSDEGVAVLQNITTCTCQEPLVNTPIRETLFQTGWNYNGLMIWRNAQNSAQSATLKFSCFKMICEWVPTWWTEANFSSLLVPAGSFIIAISGLIWTIIHRDGRNFHANF